MMLKNILEQVYKYDFKPTRADGTKKSLSDAIKEIAGIRNKRHISKLFYDTNLCTKR